MAKEFKRSFMHKTRRRLADMVHTGEYETSTVSGWSSPTEFHKIGDIWEDEHNRYEQKDGYIVKASKNSEVFQEIRDYLNETTICKNPKCKRINKSKTDKKLIKKTGYCIDCLAEIETKIKAEGFWKDYQNYRIWTEMIKQGKTQLELIKQAHDDAKQVYDYVNEDGTLEHWRLPDSVENVKSDMKDLIKKGTTEISELETKRNEVFEILKKNNYDCYL